MSEKITVVNKGGGGRGGGIGSIFSFFRFIFSFTGVISITLILAIITSVTAIAHSIDQGSPLPFIKEVGGKLINYDLRLYTISKEMQEKGGILIQESGFMGKLKAFWNMLGNIGNFLYMYWTIYFWLFLFYKVAIHVFIHDNSKTTSGAMIAVLMFLMIGIIFNLVVIDEKSKTIDTTLLQKVNPIKGVIESFKTIPFLFNFVDSNKPIIEQTINEIKNETNINISII